MQNPLIVLHAFYHAMDFYTWRAELHNWLEAGLGKQTITHISNTENVLPVMEQLNKLVEATYLIHQAHLGEMISRKKKRNIDSYQLIAAGFQPEQLIIDNGQLIISERRKLIREN